MELKWFDISVFLGFIGLVIATSLYKSRKSRSSEDYFLAGRQLFWWLIGFSLIASNISTEQFVGMNGQAAGNVGLAIASYDWIAAISLVLIAIFFLPKFLKSGIYTIPEYLEYRYCPAARAVMALYTTVIYVAVTIAAVIYAGAMAIETIFGLNLIIGVWLVGIIAAIYTTYGGLRAVVWTDLIQGSCLLIGGAIITVIGFVKVGGLQAFYQTNAHKLHMFLPSENPVLPWSSLIIGLWIPNFYYWGLNQYIMQRSLAAKSLKQGQLGVILAAGIQVILPLIIVIPGIMAQQLYSEEVAANNDAAFPILIKELVPIGLRGFLLAAILGAIMSSLDSMLNSASTIFTMDLYKRHLRRTCSARSLIKFGRLITVIFTVIGCLIAPQLGSPRFHGIFNYIQEFQGFISPGILAAFVFGLIFKRAPGSAGLAALIFNVPIYGLLLIFFQKDIAFLNRMAITFGSLIAIMAALTFLKPLPQPMKLPRREGFDMKLAPSVIWLGSAVIIATIALYIIFR